MFYFVKYNYLFMIHLSGLLKLTLEKICNKTKKAIQSTAFKDYLLNTERNYYIVPP